MQFRYKKLPLLIYQTLPTGFQDILFSLLGYYDRRKRYGHYFQDTLESLKQSQWWSKEKIETYQREHLEQITTYAVFNVPFYRNSGLKPVKSLKDLDAFPIIDKKTILKNYKNFVPETNLSIETGLTSGTTGTPLEVRYTKKALQYQWAVWWRHKSRFGLNPGDKYLTFGARQPVPLSQNRPPFWRNNRAYNQTYLSVYHISDAFLPFIVDFLNEQNFKFYTGYPSAIYLLADYLARKGVELKSKPQYVVTGSEALIPFYENCIEKNIGVPVTDQYGSAECCVNASKCEYKNYHEDFEFCHIELVDMPGQPSNLKKIISTGFQNYGFPLIRYDTGDYAVVTDEKCNCGRSSRIIKRIDGRIEDFIITPDNRKVIGFNQALEWAENVQAIQLVQYALNEVEVNIVPGFSYKEKNQEMLINELKRRLGNSMNFTIKLVSSVEKTKNGKIRAVVNKLDKSLYNESELQAIMSEGIY